jgi:hypothetical protein
LVKANLGAIGLYNVKEKVHRATLEEEQAGFILTYVGGERYDVERVWKLPGPWRNI